MPPPLDSKLDVQDDRDTPRAAVYAYDDSAAPATTPESQGRLDDVPASRPPPYVLDEGGGVYLRHELIEAVQDAVTTLSGVHKAPQSPMRAPEASEPPQAPQLSTAFLTLRFLHVILTLCFPLRN